MVDVSWWAARLLGVPELTSIAFSTSAVVMANEAHSGLMRCQRTRRVGVEIVAAASELGVRRLAMEALRPDFAAEANRTRCVPDTDDGYLAQADMRELIQSALDDGWTLHCYEAEIASAPADVVRDGTMSNEFTNWREGQQASNLARLTAAGERLLVWCGNGHHTKRLSGWWRPMGYLFMELTGIEPFCIDQAPTCEWPNHEPNLRVDDDLATALGPFGGTAAVLASDIPHTSFGDAVVVSTDNSFV